MDYRLDPPDIDEIPEDYDESRELEPDYAQILADRAALRDEESEWAGADYGGRW